MTTVSIKKTNASVETTAHIPLFPGSVSTSHQSSDRVTLNAVAVTSDAASRIRDVYDELEWHSIVSKPSVREALRRMAIEARRQYYAGETEEGGFAVE